MSMCLGYCTLSDENVRKVLADPPLVWKVVAPDDPEAYETALAESAGLFSRLLGRKPAPAELALGEGEGEGGDLDKAWHGIHYLLTKSAWEGPPPLNFLVAGGAPAGNIDVGYGPARLFTAAQVQALHEALKPIDGAFLRQRFDPGEMMRLDIYPSFWDRDPAEDDTLGYCIDNFESLKAFVAQAAARRMGLVLYLS